MYNLSHTTREERSALKKDFYHGFAIVSIYQERLFAFILRE